MGAAWVCRAKRSRPFYRRRDSATFPLPKATKAQSAAKPATVPIRVALEVGHIRTPRSTTSSPALKQAANRRSFVARSRARAAKWGQLLRTAEICGVHGVVVQERRAPDITPHIVAAAVGATEHLLIAQVTNLNSAIDTLKQAGVWIVGLDIDPTAHKFGQIDLNMPLGVVVGHEGSGMRRRVKESCDILLQLPMRGKVDSLNASVAGRLCSARRGRHEVWGIAVSAENLLTFLQSCRLANILSWDKSPFTRPNPSLQTDQANELPEGSSSLVAKNRW